jgi:hypothetical protein
MRYVAVIAVALLALCGSAHAERFRHLSGKSNAMGTTLQCTSVTDVGTLRNVLYKNENVHGGRGRTFLDQGHRFRGVRTLKIAAMNGTVYACFGLYRCDSPFGCRYYQAMCGDSVSNSQFARKAQQLGGSYYALVGTGNGACYKILTTVSRYGSVYK